MTASGMFQEKSLLLAGASAFSMSTLFSAMKPILLTRFVEQAAFSDSLAGFAVASPFLGIAIASLCLKYLFSHMKVSTLVRIFGSMLIAAEVCSAFYFQYYLLLLVVQLTAGMCVGVLIGAISRVIATTVNTDEIFGFVDMMAVMLMSFMVAAMGAAVANYGLEGGYLLAAGISFILTALMSGFKDAPRKQTIIQARRLQLSIRNLTVVFMGVLFVTSSGMGFAYMFSIAISLGMDYSNAGSFIGILLLASAAACQFGGWCSSRFGPYWPLAFAFISCALGWYFAINAATATIFMLALVPAIFSLQFNFPILLALCGSLDTEGQWAAIATPLLVSGFAWAAIAASTIVSHFEVAALGTATVIGMLACLVLLLISRPPAQLDQTAIVG